MVMKLLRWLGLSQSETVAERRARLRREDAFIKEAIETSKKNCGDEPYVWPKEGAK